MKLFALQESVSDSTAAIETRFADVSVRITALDREVARLSELMDLSRLDTEPQPLGESSFVTSAAQQT